MGNKQSVNRDPNLDDHGLPINRDPKRSYLTTNPQKFVPIFTTKTATLVDGYVREQATEHKIVQIVPTELVELIYTFVKNNCTFILILEHDSQPQHSYLHEIDLESGTNQNLSVKYGHKQHIWKRLPAASYCYGRYNDQTAIYRIAGEETMACTLKTGEVHNLPKLDRYFAQSVYSARHGLIVLGGYNRPVAMQNTWRKESREYASNDVYRFNAIQNSWQTSMCPMILKRAQHLAVLYESRCVGVSDKIFCLGDKGPTEEYDRHGNVVHNIQTPEASPTDYDFNKDGSHLQCYDFVKDEWEIANSRWTLVRQPVAGCIDAESDRLVVCRMLKRVEQYDLVKNVWSQVGEDTNYPHDSYPCVTKNNHVVVVFGHETYSETNKQYGYVEYFDERDNNQKWTVLTTLRELLEFSVQQVRNGFYQHALQM